MPNLDVSEVLSDPDFFDILICTRNVQSVGTNGLATLAQTSFNFMGVVTADSGRRLQRGAEGERTAATISVVTRTQLRVSTAANTADTVTWNGRQYAVVDVADYSRYGSGFIEATCEQIPLGG